MIFKLLLLCTFRGIEFAVVHLAGYVAYIYSSVLVRLAALVVC